MIWPTHLDMCLWMCVTYCHLQSTVSAILLSRNGASENIVYHRRNTDTAVFRQISSYFSKLPYAGNLAKWF